jgi:gliding motility-associated-like protein
VLRVTTQHPTDPFRAWSNYVPFEIKLRDVVIKNVVTPNGDGINDFFHIEEIEYFPDSYLTLFNRWGQIVFEQAAYQNDYSPTDLEAGTYIYVLTIPGKPDLTGAMRVVR